MASSTHSTLPAREYDFVVVGGGTSGLVVACRLSEDPTVQVLVLEAGDNRLEDPRINIPAGWSALLGSDLDWSFETAPQDALNGRTLRHPQGKVLGGSSAINAEAFIAPSKADIEAWGSLGNAGWNWDTLLPYYRKFHTLTPPPEETSKHLGIDWIDPNVRGTDGPIQVSFQGVIQDPLSNAWVETFKKLGHGLKSDPFSGQAMGGYSSPLTVDPEAKVRSYAANTYFIAASARQNLHVVTGALTEKILFESKDDLVIAKGVSVNIKGETHTVTARKEVILAAGAFQTPKLLELSGIGNKDLLQSHGIPVMIDNPNVGENLQDHLMTGISIEVNDGIFTGDGMMRQEPEALNGAMQMYATAKAGPLCAGGIGSHAFMSLADATNAKDELAAVLADSPDSEQVNLLRSMVENNQEATGAMFMFPAQVNLHNDPKTKSFVQDLRPGNYLSIGISLLHPFSRGNVHITSSSPSAPPKIDPKYLSSPIDLLILAGHLQEISTLASTQPLSSQLKPNGQRNHSSAHHACDSLDKAKAYVRDTVISNNHPACSCPMLPRDKGGVVNERLMVHGTRGLRIVDASIMPTIPRANTQATVYAVAERAADLIKEDY